MLAISQIRIHYALRLYAFITMVIDKAQCQQDAFIDHEGNDGSEAHTVNTYLGSRSQSEDNHSMGIPSLLVPVNSDWSPTDRDRRAPPVLASRTMMGKLHTKFTRRPGKPLQPTPMSFLRPAPPPSRSGPTYSSFQAFYLPGRHKSQIAKGFEPRYPADIMVDHDVSAVDWDRFLLNLQVAGALRGRDQLIANVLPASLIIVNAGIGNYWITRGIMNSLQRRYIPEVLALVETYQYRFFQQRKLDVFVACGTSRMTGYFPGDDSYLHAPSVEIGLPLTSDSSSSSSSDCESSDSDQGEDLNPAPGEQKRQIKEAERSEQVSNKSMSEMDPGYYATTDARLKSYKIDKKRLKEERREKKKEERQKRREMRKEERQKRHEMRKEERQARSNDKKHGKYRIVIEPMEKPIVQPSGEWLLQLEEREKEWGHSGNTISGAEVRVNSQ